MKARPLPSIAVIKALFDYDPETGMFTHKIGRPGCRKGHPAGHAGDNGRLRLHIEGKHVLANRVAWLWVYGVAPDLVDHWDGDVTNNSILNLRDASYAQNNWNSSRHSDKSDGLPKGIRLNRNGKFRAIIQVNGYRFSVGSYHSLEEAVVARKNVGIKYHGNFYNEG